MRIAVAAVSARLMAEAAARDGFDVIALDLFGDADTRAAARRWVPIGRVERLHIDAHTFAGALRELARDDVSGWVAGSGLEGRPELIEQGAAVLPLLGTPADAVRRIRDPRDFFGLLVTHGIAHPEVRFTAPPDPAGWLLKDALGTGGWHVRRACAADTAPASAHQHYQRELDGVPMSATFVADGQAACVLGFNHIRVCRIGARPFVFSGVTGPVALPDAAALEMRRALDVLVAAYGVLGLGSLDFMLDREGGAHVIELNPRPPASMALYADRLAGGLMRAHVRACTARERPTLRAVPAGVCGTQIVYARRAFSLTGAAAQRLAQWPLCHDRPLAGMRFDAGDPVCSLSVQGTSPEEIGERLSAEAERLLDTLEIA